MMPMGGLNTNRASSGCPSFKRGEEVTWEEIEEIRRGIRNGRYNSWEVVLKQSLTKLRERGYGRTELKEIVDEICNRVKKG